MATPEDRPPREGGAHRADPPAGGTQAADRSIWAKLGATGSFMGGVAAIVTLVFIWPGIVGIADPDSGSSQSQPSPSGLPSPSPSSPLKSSLSLDPPPADPRPPSPEPSRSPTLSPDPEPPVVMTSPRDNATVGRCTVFSGRSSLPPGQTIVVANRNLGLQDTTLFFEAVADYDQPASLTEWMGVSWFGAEASAGQTYEVQVFVAAVDTVQSKIDGENGNGGRGWYDNSLPPGSQVQREIRVTRVAGEGNCP